MTRLADRSFAPLLMRREQAARHVALSPNTFDKFVRIGALPKPKVLQGVKAWDVRDLEACIDQLPYVADTSTDTTWDD